MYCTTQLKLERMLEEVPVLVVADARGRTLRCFLTNEEMERMPASSNYLDGLSGIADLHLVVVLAMIRTTVRRRDVA